jgi:hypothetical protein
MVVDVPESIESAEPPAQAPIVRTRSVASYRTNLITALLGLWFTVGLFLDAWAHNNKPELETIFTPWHAVFYSGFSATAAWAIWTCRRALEDGARTRAAVPYGYGPTIVAVAGFAVAGVADLTWHQVFGIEQSIDILFSPTHLGLIATMLVIVTTPLRSAWADRALPAEASLRRLLPAVLSLAFATTLVLLFVQYANAMTLGPLDVLFALAGSFTSETGEFASKAAITTAVLIIPLLMFARRWRLPVGVTMIVFAACGALSSAVTGLHNVEMVAGVLVGGLGVEVLALILRPRAGRVVQFRAFGGLAMLVTWICVEATAYVFAPTAQLPPELGGGDLPAKPELFIGVPLVQGLIGLLLAVLLLPSKPVSSASLVMPGQPARPST